MPILEQLGLRAIVNRHCAPTAGQTTTFALDLSHLCYDVISVSFWGEHEDTEAVRYGCSRDHRPDRKQLEPANTVTLKAGVSIDYRVLASNVAAAVGVAVAVVFYDVGVQYRRETAGPSGIPCPFYYFEKAGVP